jgi:TusA-related sulfurtransferase
VQDGGVVLQRVVGTTPPLESRAYLEPLMHADKEIDTRGLSCPLPILKAKKALAELQSGQLLKVLATDPSSIRDFQAFSKQTGNELVEQQTLADGESVHLLRRR